MKFTIEKEFKGEYKGLCNMTIEEVDGSIGLYTGTNNECWDYVERYVCEHKTESFSVIDVFGKQHDYFRVAGVV